jgi:hypothetical protein
MTQVDNSRSVAYLWNHLSEAAESALCANTVYSDEGEHRVYEQGIPQTYLVQEETPADRSVILERYSDGKRFRVSFEVTVEEM